MFTRTKHGAAPPRRPARPRRHRRRGDPRQQAQGQRVRALDDFKDGRVAILVATEVAARGLDIDGLPHVVNFELPTVPEDYVHRIGRTGRAGMEGDAVSLVCVDELELLHDIERCSASRSARDRAGLRADRTIRAEPIREVRRGNRPSPSRRRHRGSFHRTNESP